MGVVGVICFIASNNTWGKLVIKFNRAKMLVFINKLRSTFEVKQQIIFFPFLPNNVFDP